MPMLDAYIPEGALMPEAERKLSDTCTDLLLKYEGAAPRDERTRAPLREAAELQKTAAR